MESFNPKPAQGTHIHHSLIELFSQISPIFKRNFIALNKKRFNRHPFERISTPVQVNLLWIKIIKETKYRVIWCVICFCANRSSNLIFSLCHLTSNNSTDTSNRFLFWKNITWYVRRYSMQSTYVIYTA